MMALLLFIIVVVYVSLLLFSIQQRTFISLGLARFFFLQQKHLELPHKTEFVDKLFLSFTSLAILYVFLPLGEADFLSKLLYLKGILLIPIFYFLGRNTRMDQQSITRLFNLIMIVAIAAFCLNVIEKVIGVHFQQFTGYALFNFAVNGIDPSGNFGLSWTFETQTSGMRLASFFQILWNLPVPVYWLFLQDLFGT
tara:strand:- start:7024 stop:7611 length:588 start_codon:yes stop_codon:yes gene_type:complete